ncbi:MAG: hypothetical protein WHW07_09150 [Bacteroidales bacterium]
MIPNFPSGKNLALSKVFVAKHRLPFERLSTQKLSPSLASLAPSFTPVPVIEFVS